MQILLPMSGNGSRFSEAGYVDPKPLIDVDGLPMIERVIENLGYDHEYTFVIREEHWNGNEARFGKIFEKTQSFAIRLLSAPTDGAARTCLEAEGLVDSSRPLMIANCDQIMDWDKTEFYKEFTESWVDGTILTFKSTNPAHSYAKVENDKIVQVAEKVVISDIATVGVYVWRRSVDFFNSARSMISKNIRTNNEFYVCPTFNEAIEQGMVFSTYDIPSHHPVGTPEQLEKYLKILESRKTPEAKGIPASDFDHWE